MRFKEHFKNALNYKYLVVGFITFMFAYGVMHTVFHVENLFINTGNTYEVLALIVLSYFLGWMIADILNIDIK